MQIWKDALQKQLRVLERYAEFKIWDDRQITPGDGWLKEIETAPVRKFNPNGFGLYAIKNAESINNQGGEAL